MMKPLLLKQHFQVAYVVRDISHAIERLRERFGIEKWEVIDWRDFATEEQPFAKIALAFAGELMVELMEPLTEGPSRFTEWIPQLASAARFHHLGFLLHSEDEWQEVNEKLSASGYPTIFEGGFGDFVDYRCVDTVTDLGHYCELVRLKSEGMAYFSRIPRNG
jgi:hypothetical protein